MPWKDKEKNKRMARFRNRDIRHPGWRQTYVNYNGMCAKCGEVDGLEFHEPFGEDKGDNGGPKLQSRVLLCNACHAAVHDQQKDNAHVNPRFFPSMLQQDVSWEIAEHGGYQQRLKDFGLEDNPGFVPEQLTGD